MTLSKSKSNSTEQMRMLRLLQWQLQQFLTPELEEKDTAKTSIDSAFDVKIGRSSEFGGAGHLQLEVKVLEGNKLEDDKTDDYRKGDREAVVFNPVWVIQIVEALADSTPVELYAQAGISNYWWLDLNNIELHTYQQLEASGYCRHRVLQVGDCASPDRVPLIVKLQEPVPLHFMTRTLNGQQTYQTHAMPFSFSLNSIG